MPAILAGSPALLVALVGSLAVMLVTMALSHGTGFKSPRDPRHHLDDLRDHGRVLPRAAARPGRRRAVAC